jgi:hypothetical protein
LYCAEEKKTNQEEEIKNKNSKWKSSIELRPFVNQSKPGVGNLFMLEGGINLAVIK